MPRAFDGGTVYVVRPGDTMSAIARAQGVSLDSLVAANAGLVTNPNVIRIGWQLLIPGTLSGVESAAPAGAAVEEHAVVPGDTLSELAARWGTTVSAIAALNGIANPGIIHVGQRIRRPGATVSVRAETQPAPASDGRLVFHRYPLDLPPAVITGGYREDYGGYLHRGLDIGGVAVGTAVRAPAPGIVTTHRPGDGWGSGSFGNCVILDHPGTPWYTIYGHLNELRCQPGDSVNTGDVIGTVGFTGRVVPPGPAGAHLHWQLSDHINFPPDFQYIANPLDFLVL